MEIFSEDLNLSRWVIATAGLIIILAGGAILARVFGPVGQARVKLKNKKRRIKVTEVSFLDAGNKICIFEIDEIEHAVLLSPKGAMHLQTKNLAKDDSEKNEDDKNKIGFLKELEEDVKIKEN